jgi:hypothetical protein
MPLLRRHPLSGLLTEEGEKMSDEHGCLDGGCKCRAPHRPRKEKVLAAVCDAGGRMNRPEGMPSADKRTPLISGNAQYLGRTITDDMVIRNQQVIDGLREEIARLRELIPQAWEAGTEFTSDYWDDRMPRDEAEGVYAKSAKECKKWMKQKGLA